MGALLSATQPLLFDLSAPPPLHRSTRAFSASMSVVSRVDSDGDVGVDDDADMPNSLRRTVVSEAAKQRPDDPSVRHMRGRSSSVMESVTAITLPQAPSAQRAHTGQMSFKPHSHLHPQSNNFFDD